MFAPWLANAGLLCLASVQLAYWLAWGGSLALSIALVVLMWTRWGHSRPLQKCAALSLLVHLVLAFLTMTVRIVVGDGTGGGGSVGGPIHVRIIQDGSAVTTTAPAATELVNDIAAPPLLEPPAKSETTPKPVAAVETPPAKSVTPSVAKEPVVEPTK